MPCLTLRSCPAGEYMSAHSAACSSVMKPSLISSPVRYFCQTRFFSPIALGAFLQGTLPVHKAHPNA